MKPKTSNLVDSRQAFHRTGKQTGPADNSGGRSIREYARARLTDGIFRELRKTILEGPAGAAISLEVQDLYLADPSCRRTRADLSKRTGGDIPTWEHLWILSRRAPTRH